MLEQQFIKAVAKEVTPSYANKEMLLKLSEHKTVVNYALSREMALVDLNDFKTDFFKQEKELFLSELPVVVYNTNGEPKYYEFIVSNGQKNIGTITCFAQKEAHGFTAFVLPFVRDYAHKNAQLYSHLYPQVAQSSAENELPALAMELPTADELEFEKETKEFWEALEGYKEGSILTKAYHILKRVLFF